MRRARVREPYSLKNGRGPGADPPTRRPRKPPEALLRCPKCWLLASEIATRTAKGFECSVSGGCPSRYELVDLREYPGWAQPGPGRGPAPAGAERGE
jgi:hypothetical protein